MPQLLLVAGLLLVSLGLVTTHDAHPAWGSGSGPAVLSFGGTCAATQCSPAPAPSSPTNAAAWAALVGVVGMALFLAVVGRRRRWHQGAGRLPAGVTPAVARPPR